MALTQVDDMYTFRRDATPEMKDNFQGMMQTVWSDSKSFLEGFYGIKKDKEQGENTPWQCFRTMYSRINEVK